MEWQRGRYRATDDRSSVELHLVASFLAEESYWSPGIPRETVERAVHNSLCLSVFDGADQVGFARLVTDRATFAYLCDVFVVPGHRGRGLGHWLGELAVEHPDLVGVRRVLLGTRDAQEIYRDVGFGALADPAALMEIRHRPQDLYG